MLRARWTRCDSLPNSYGCSQFEQEQFQAGFDTTANRTFSARDRATSEVKASLIVPIIILLIFFTFRWAITGRVRRESNSGS